MTGRRTDLGLLHMMRDKYSTKVYHYNPGTSKPQAPL
jgi:hypothetical protein